MIALVYWKFKSGKDKMTWRTIPAQIRTVTSSITATGTINPVTQVNVGTEVSGKIERIYKDFNDFVRRGDLLAKLDTTTLEMALEDARIELRKIQLTANENLIDLNNARELYEQSMIAQFELQRAQYTYDLAMENIEKAKFSVQRAETNLNNARIYSPIDGVIIHRAVDEGQTVAASLNAPTLFIIANNLDEMQIEAQIDEADIGKVKTEQRARFTIDAFPERNFHGRVKQVRLNPIVESNVVSYKVIVSLTNPDRVIMPGMTANVEIIIDQRQDVLAISSRAMQFRPTKEIWESFKLAWNDSLAVTSRMRGRPGGGGGGGGDAPQVSRPQPGMTMVVVEQTVGGGRRRQQQDSQTPTTQKVQIWILENDTPTQATVELGISDGNFMEVISGINEGTEVIVGVNQANVQSAQASAFGGGMRMRF